MYMQWFIFENRQWSGYIFDCKKKNTFSCFGAKTSERWCKFRADPEFLERVFICIKMCGFALLI